MISYGDCATCQHCNAPLTEPEDHPRVRCCSPCMDKYPAIRRKGKDYVATNFGPAEVGDYHPFATECRLPGSEPDVEVRNSPYLGLSRFRDPKRRR